MKKMTFADGMSAVPEGIRLPAAESEKGTIKRGEKEIADFKNLLPGLIFASSCAILYHV